MENASKALIIAGAILIAILLISVGIMIMNAVNNPASQVEAQANAQAMQIHNEKFTPYSGSIDGQEARQLISTIITNNATSEKKIKVTTSGDSFTTTARITSSSDGTTINGVINSISLGKTYNVTFTYVSGYIDAITIAG